jgi:Leucine-rich repeat (LRR) protein
MKRSRGVASVGAGARGGAAGASGDAARRPAGRRARAAGVPPTQRELERAARVLQGMYRSRAARRRLRLLARSVFERVLDPDTGSHFYHNKHTGDVSWIKPALLGSEDFDKVERSKVVSPHDRVTAYRALAKDWRCIDVEGGSAYFVNSVTGESTWDRPGVVAELDAALAERDEMLGPDWEEVHAPDAGGYYFFNKATQEASWTPPKGVDHRKSPEQKAKEAKEAAREAARKLRAAERAAGRGVLAADSSDDEEGKKRAPGAAPKPGSDSDSADEEPPEAIKVGLDGKLDAKDEERFKEDSSEDDSVYVSSDEEERRERAELEAFEAAEREAHALEADNADKGDNADNAGKAGKADNADKADKAGKAAAGKAAALAGKAATDEADKADKGDKADTGDKAGKADKVDKAGKADKAAAGKAAALAGKAKAAADKAAEEASALAPALSKREVKRRRRRRERRERQLDRHEDNLARLEEEGDAAACKAYEVRVRVKRARKRRSAALDLSDLNLSAAPRELFLDAKLAPSLTSLDLGLNRLTSLPYAIKRLRGGLVRLKADSCQLLRLPAQLWYLTRLQELDLRCNRLAELPREKGDMVTLREMNVWEIGLETLAELRVLRLCRNELREVPDTVCALKSLEVLTVRGNRVASLPASGLERLQRLRHLDLSGNLLDLIPLGLSLLPLLDTLLVASNNLAALPDDIGLCPALRVFDCADNLIKALPTSFSEMAAAQVLVLAGNALSQLAGDWAGHMSRTLRVLDLSRNKLQRLPESLGGLAALEHLDVSHNLVAPRLPAGLALAARLRSLCARHNELEAVGWDDWSKLTSLARVDLSHNRLGAVHGSALLLAPSLSDVDLSHNRIAEIVVEPPPPPHQQQQQRAAARLSSAAQQSQAQGPPPVPPVPPGAMALRRLDLSHNELERLPRELFSQTRLAVLDASDNRIAVLPPEVVGLADSLIELGLSGNRIRSLPLQQLGELRRLRALDVSRNLLQAAPSQLLQALPALRTLAAGNNPLSYAVDARSATRRRLCDADVLLQKGEQEAALALLDAVLDELLGGEQVAQAMGAALPAEKGVPRLRAVVAGADALLVEDWQVLEELLRKRAGTLLALERYDETEQCATLALALHDQPTTALLFFRAAARLRGLNDPAGAVADLDRAIEIDKEYRTAFRLRAQALIELGHYDRAIADAELVIKFDMFDQEAMLSRALALERSLKLELALDGYKALIALCEGGGREAVEARAVAAAAADAATDAAAAAAAAVAPDADADADAPPDPADPVDTHPHDTTSLTGRDAEPQAKRAAPSAWSPLGVAYYRTGLVLRDLGKAGEAAARFQTASELLYAQVGKARAGSLRQKRLAETLRLAVLCKSSALQTMNRGKKAMDAYLEARALDDDAH